MDNPENTERAITNRQSRETGNMGNTRHNTKLLNTTGGKYETNIVFMWKL